MESHSIISENQGYDSTRIIFVTSCTLIATYVLKTVFNRRNVQKQLPPRIPHTIPFLGHAISFGESPIEFLVAAYHKYGSVFSFTMVGKTFTYLVGPDMSAPFFDSKNDDLNAEEVYGKLVTPVFGKGVAYDVPNHVFLQQKKIFKTGLNVGRFKLHVPVIEEETEAYFSRWGEAGEKDIFKSLSELIILTASSCLHGKEIRSVITEEVAQLYTDLDGGFSAEAWLLPSWLPLPSFKKRDLALKKLKTMFYSAINKRRNSEEMEDDMLQTLLEATYKDGRALNNEEVSGMLIGLLMAGQHTSSSTSSWIGFYLAKHPHIQDAVYKEIKKCCGECGPLDYDGLNDCELLNRCIKETLRLRPPVMTMMRMCKVPLKVGNYVIPPGHQVCVSPTVTQRLPSVWQHWDQFIPDRFLDKSTSSEDRFSYIPFGGGRHRCIGESFAYVQIKTIWATLLRMYQFELVDGNFPEVNYTTMIHSPKNPVIRYRRRSTDLDTR